MSKKQTENKDDHTIAKGILETLLKQDDTLTVRNALHQVYFKVFGANKVPLNGSDDVLRACIQELKDYYKLD